MEREPAERRKRKAPAARKANREPSREELLEMIEALLHSPYAHETRQVVELLYERHLRCQAESRAATADTPIRRAAQGLPGGAPTPRRKG